MKEFLEAIAAYGPRFLSEIVDFVSGPKGFLRQLELGASDAVPRALTFFVLCVAVSLVLELPFASGPNDLPIALSVALVLYMTGTVLIAAMYKLAFGLLRGKGSFHDHLLVTLYVSGPFYIFESLFAAASKGVVLSNAPDLYPLFKMFMDASLSWSSDLTDFAKFFPLFESVPVLMALALASITLLGSTAWMIVCWGSYRHINRTGRVRSTLAAIVAGSLSIPLYYVLTSAQRGLKVNLF